MEYIAKGLVGHEVVLTILRKPKFKFERGGRIVDVQNGVIKIKGPSGMETAIPLDDEYMKVESIRALP